MTDSSDTDFSHWFAGIRPLYERMGESVVTIVTELLRANDIDYLAIVSRAKALSSFAEKVKRKRYIDPALEMTDLCGVRIVTYLNSDVERVGQLLRSAFAVDESNSIDKSTTLATDRVGYRSVHLVCSLGPEREALGEYSSFHGLRFEVQVRTALQHAWAQVEHDRNYKFGGVLPTTLQRRLHLAAGTLELVDAEFDRIAVDVESYAKSIAQQAEHGTPNAELNTTSLRSLLSQRAEANLKAEFRALDRSGPQTDLMDELRRFGIATLADVDILLSPEFFAARNKHPEADGYTNEFGLMRDAMMYADIERYFTDAYDSTWGGVDESTFAMLASKYGTSAVNNLLAKHDVDVIPPDSYLEEADDNE